MSYLEIEGGHGLGGGIRIQGSKNAALPILSAAILHSGITVLHNCPRIIDVKNMLEILKGFGCRVDWEGDALVIDATSFREGRVEEEYAGKMRSSIMLLGSLLGRTGGAWLPYPGGCVIGKRPIDLHLAALKEMGVEIRESESGIEASCQKPKGAAIRLPFPSVGATENVILLAVLAEGTTVLNNAAREPEIRELCAFLGAMGAKIQGAGGARIVITGVESLHDAEFTIVSDRIVAGTYMLLTAVAGGEAVLKKAPWDQLQSVCDVVGRMGVSCEWQGADVKLVSRRRLRSPGSVKTSPYPGFPTDLQSPLMAALASAKGESQIQETIFEARFKVVEELQKMGADIRVEGQNAKIRGVERLCGARLMAKELRGGAALVLAAAGAKGISRIDGFGYIERGYENIIRDLQALGVVVNLREEE